MDYIQMSLDHVAELYPSVVYARPRLMDLPPGAIIGTWAYSVPGKVRFILDKSLEVAPGVLPGDLARSWIRDTFKLPFRRRQEQLKRTYSAPIHAVCGSHGDCAYVDIKHAYLSILRFGYDVEYRPGKYIGAMPAPVPEEIAKNKFAYAIAVTMSGPARSNLEVMGKEGLFPHKPINLYANPCLFNLAQDTLNGIASEILAVLGENVVYANTDGFIVRSGFERYALDIIQSWGLNAIIKSKNGVLLQGETEVFGVGGFRIGEYSTKRHDHGKRDFTSKLMTQAERRWLKTSLSRWFSQMSNLS